MKRKLEAEKNGREKIRRKNDDLDSQLDQPVAEKVVEKEVADYEMYVVNLLRVLFHSVFF